MTTSDGSEPTTSSSENQEQSSSARRRYLMFVAMIVTSTTAMFLLTYTNVFTIDHVRWSEERFYMAMLMGSVMAIIMLAFMWAMYPNRKVNVALIVVALILGGAGLGLSRSQALVTDVAYMDAMIPHHSIAILTSERAGIHDVRVRELADGIIETQREEIAEMTWLVADIRENGAATTEEDAARRPVPESPGSE